MLPAGSESILSGTAGYRINSPLLFTFLQKLPEEGYYHCLDLAPANLALLDYFAQFHCKLYLPNCAGELLGMDTEQLDTPQKRRALIAGLLHLEGYRCAGLDIILLWDLINYLPAPVLSDLIDYLREYTGRQTIIHGYVYTRQSMPASPATFRFTTEEAIDVMQTSQAMSKCPAYYQEVLHRLLKPFVVQRSILLSSGLQEYLFHLPPRHT
jgi:hypothetical protein